MPICSDFPWAVKWIPKRRRSNAGCFSKLPLSNPQEPKLVVESSNISVIPEAYYPYPADIPTIPLEGFAVEISRIPSTAEAS